MTFRAALLITWSESEALAAWQLLLFCYGVDAVPSTRTEAHEAHHFRHARSFGFGLRLAKAAGSEVEISNARTRCADYC
jgi:hypothetical protein